MFEDVFKCRRFQLIQRLLQIFLISGMKSNLNTLLLKIGIPFDFHGIRQLGSIQCFAQINAGLIQRWETCLVNFFL